MVVNEKMNKELVDKLKFWGDIILSSLSSEDESLYSAVEYAWKHPEEISIDSVELTVIANSQVEDMENIIEEFYNILTRMAEENENQDDR